MTDKLPDWLNPEPWLRFAREADAQSIQQAVFSEEPGERELALLLSPQAGEQLELMARRAQSITRRHFGRTIGLYAPLYLSNYCSGGCLYCGFASDRDEKRQKLTRDEATEELLAMREMGIEEILLLTGERTPHADFDYLHEHVSLAAEYFHRVIIEVFPMAKNEYRQLAEAGCTGVTLYQETYDPVVYEKMHRWGPKRDFSQRLEAPERALGGGLRSAGLGALLGLGDPVFDMLCLYRHAKHLLKHYWQAGVSLSFPRIRPQLGGFQPEHPVDEKMLAQFAFAFRICLPEVPLVLSTREGERVRDGLAGVGISKMSVASKTTVGGYSHEENNSTGQFEISDDRDPEAFCAMLRSKGLEPVFKNWDSAYRETAHYQQT
ncbi:MAG: 2-iminoacetate synthase ThiH [Kiritimatiellales bacterium]|nr:2-iminoacetate synthase ThiH [Kiritimatiellales bacterium]